MAIEKKVSGSFGSYEPPKTNRLSEFEIMELDRELEKFYITKRVEFPEPREIRILDEVKWLQSKGAVGKTGGVFISGYVRSVYNTQGHLVTPSDCDPIKYQQCMEDLDQWNRWKGRNQQAEKSKLQQLDEMRQGLAKNKKI